MPLCPRTWDLNSNCAEMTHFVLIESVVTISMCGLTTNLPGHPLFKKLHEIPALVDHLMVIVFMLHSCALPLPSFPVSHPNLQVRPRHPTLCGFNERGTGPPWEPPACACPQTQTRKPSNCHHTCVSQTQGNPQTAVANNPQTTPKIQGLRLRKDPMGSKQWPTLERIRTGQTEHSLLPVSTQGVLHSLRASLPHLRFLQRNEQNFRTGAFTRGCIINGVPLHSRPVMPGRTRTRDTLCRRRPPHW